MTLSAGTANSPSTREILKWVLRGREGEEEAEEGEEEAEEGERQEGRWVGRKQTWAEFTVSCGDCLCKRCTVSFGLCLRDIPHLM